MEADEAGTLELEIHPQSTSPSRSPSTAAAWANTTGDLLPMEFSSVTDGVQSAIEIQEALA